MGCLHHLTPPTSSLPSLSRLAKCSLEQITQALQNLRVLYIDQRPLPLPKVLAKGLPTHLIHDTSVPDSGYASAEEDDCDDVLAEDCEEEDTASFDLDALRSDAFERDFTIRWLTGFTARSHLWVCSADTETESDARAALVDSAASILASFAGEDEEEALTRRFVFPTCDTKGIVVELNDAPLLSEDHTSVGLQSWASSILLAERMCASPRTFNLAVAKGERRPRVLELGAGTGLLSIAAAKLLHSNTLEPCSKLAVVATDYHPSVISNLQANVKTNFPPSADTALQAGPIAVLSFDWEHPAYNDELESAFDIVLAADVIYHPHHACWIKRCVEHLLVRPDSGSSRGGLFWLIIPLRPTGRHEGMSNTVEDVFPRASIGRKLEDEAGGTYSLAILATERLERHEGVGRADEGGYKLYRIGWVQCGHAL